MGNIPLIRRIYPDISQKDQQSFEGRLSYYKRLVQDLQLIADKKNIPITIYGVMMQDSDTVTIYYYGSPESVASFNSWVLEDQIFKGKGISVEFEENPMPESS